MTEANVINFYNDLHKLGIQIWLDGGFCVDALLEKETRPHKDLDIALDWNDSDKLNTYFQENKYKKINEDSKWNYVMEDPEGRQIDVHFFVRDENGNTVDGVLYPKESLTGTGTILGQAVNCIPPKYMVEFLAPWISKWPEKYVEAVKLLCEKFNLPLPNEYKDYITKP